MINHVKHDVGTEALAKKLNEVIRIMNEGSNMNNPIQCDPQLLYNMIFDYGETCMKVGHADTMSGVNLYWAPMQIKLAQIKGMLGVK